MFSLLGLSIDRKRKNLLDKYEDKINRMTNKMSLKSKPLISELKTFVATGLGFKAKSGEHDDLVSSTLLIIRMADVLADWDPQIYDKMTEKVSEESMPMPIFVSMGL